MITPLHLQSIAELFATHIPACLLEGTLIALCAALAMRLRRQQNSATRFAIWFSALMAIAAMPFFAGTLSSLGTLRNPTPALHHSAVTLPASWALYLFAAWASIASLSLSRIAISLRHIHKLRKSCIAIDPAQLDPQVRETLTNAHVGADAFVRPVERSSTPVALCTSAEVQVPTAIGFFHPAVVIPNWLLSDLSPEELNQILLHEFAHLRRRDDWTNLIQKVVKAIFFFHPAVWWIEKKLSLEREMACDDAVLAATAKPRAYAECLTHLAERTFIRRNLVSKGIALAQAVLGRMRHTSLRVAQILNPNRPSAAKQSWKPALALIALFAVGSAVMASREPHLIAFRDGENFSMANSSPARSNTHVGTDALVRPVERSSTALTLAAPIDSSVNSALKPIPASLTQQPPAHKTFSRPAIDTLGRITPKKVSIPPQIQPTQTATIESAFIVETGITDPAANPSLVHLTSSATAPLSTETIFLLVETDQSGRPVYQVHMWRLTILPAAIPAAGKEIPRKET